MKTLTHILEGKPLGLLGGAQFTHLFSFSSAPVNLEQGISGLLGPHDLLPLLWSPSPFSLIDQRAFSGLRRQFLPLPWVSAGSCVWNWSSHPSWSCLLTWLGHTGCCLLKHIYHCSYYPMAAACLFTCFLFFFLSPKHVAETSEDILFNKHVG